MKYTKNEVLIVIVFILLCFVGIYFSSKADEQVYVAGTTQTPVGILPDSTRTPGVVNPNITQATINQTICNPHWSTKSIRPSSNYTTTLKIKQIKEYGYQDTNTADYEEDHLVSLELGGNPTDPKNLWPEAYNPSPGAKAKDTVENFLHKEVCSGQITLTEAQKEIATDWYAVYKKMYGNLGASIDTSDQNDQ